MADDFAASTATTGLVAVNGTAVGNLEVAGDHDWFKVLLVGGHKYFIRVKAASNGGGTLSDSTMDLRDAFGTVLESNDDGGFGLDPSLGVHVQRSRTYFIDVGAFNNNKVGTYTVEVVDAGIQSAQFASPKLTLAAFGADSSAGGWTSQDLTPRTLANLNADEAQDIVGFGAGGVTVALATGAGNFATPITTLVAFGASNSAGGWTSQNQFPRHLADVNGDALADIVGFGAHGTWVALGAGNGNFGAPFLSLSMFGAGNSAGGWLSQDQFPRLLGDVSGDGRADIVGFGAHGTWVALATGGGNFGTPFLSLSMFGAGDSAGGWTSQDQFPRLLGDVNGDGKADIVGFGAHGAWVALATSNGNFGTPFLALPDFGTSNSAGGWLSQNQFPRQLADVNGDGRADIIGFGAWGVNLAYGMEDGTFNPTSSDLTFFAQSAAAGGWSSQNQFPRLVAEVTGSDGTLTGTPRADIVGFGFLGVYVSQSADWILV
jgi:hypothetical protein